MWLIGVFCARRKERMWNILSRELWSLVLCVFGVPKLCLAELWICWHGMLDGVVWQI